MLTWFLRNSLTLRVMFWGFLLSLPLSGGGCTAKSAIGPDDDPGMSLDLLMSSQGADLLPPLPPVKDGSPTDRDRACASVRSEATLEKRPVDIVMVVDNSGSMTDEILAVERNINRNFAMIIGASGLDYRVILVSHHGWALVGQSICITAPLSGLMSCVPPPVCPTNGTRFFHYSTRIGSSDSLELLISTLNQRELCLLSPAGWGSWLRADATKVILEITDDETALSADEFEKKLFAKTTQFGTAMNRNYTFHTIAGLKENNPATKPWAPGDPLQMTKCTRGGGAVAPGVEYQKLSQRTGGLRFPICEFQSFDAVFQEIARGVIAGAKVKCEFPVPTPPPGQQIDLDTVRVNYQPGGGGPVQMFKKVAAANQCAPGAFYISGGKVILCQDTCNSVQGDTKAKLDVIFDCAVIIN